MILHTNETPILSSGNIEQKEFRISASGKAFKILSANLYQNKIRAFIRELSANAYDAHIAAGHPEKQFDVHMPSAIDPIFWIRDYGIGLSKESVLNLYTTYFESTKSESNDYVGALGLGSKSPFAYVDSFNVTSYFDGTITMYDMSIKDGVPNVAVLYEAETDEPNGIKIALPVRSDDFQRVAGEAKFVYSTFKTKPNFVGRSIDCDLTGVVQGKGYFSSCDRAMYNGIWALMGNIAYPVNRHEIEVNRIMDSVSSDRSVFLEFELGDLDITPSREELSYDPATIIFLQDRINQISGVLMDDILKTYEGATDPRKTIELVNKNEPYNLRNAVKKGIAIENTNLLDWENWFVWDNVHPTLGRVKYRLVEVGSCGTLTAKWTGQRSWNSTNRAGIGRNPPIIIDHDKGTDYLNTVRALVADGTIPMSTHVIAFKSTEPAHKYMLDKLVEKWRGEAKVYKVSECEDVKKAYLKKSGASGPKTPRGKPVSSEKFILCADKKTAYRTTCKYYAADIDAYEGFYAFKFFDDYVDHEERNVISSRIIENFMVLNGIEEIMVVRKTHWDRVRANPKATHVVDGVYDVLRNSSPRQVARKFGLNIVGKPAWIGHTLDVCPDLAAQFLPGTRFKHKHNLHDFYDVCTQFERFAKFADDEVKAKLSKFRGTRAAISKSAQNKYAGLRLKYPLVAKTMDSAYGYADRLSYREELNKIFG